MSLRTRLLLAIGAVTLIALVAANVATYSLLQSYLYNRVDQTLEQGHLSFSLAILRGFEISSCPGPSPFAAGYGFPSDQDFSPFPNGQGAFATQSGFVSIRTTAGKVIDNQECPAYLGATPYAPILPAHLSASQPPGPRSVTYFTSGSSPAGLRFRVRTEVLYNGQVLVLAIPLVAEDATLHKLLLTELVVSGLALVGAVAAGFALVVVGLRPLRQVEATAASITEGNLDERVPTSRGSTEVSRLASSFNSMLDSLQDAFRTRDATAVKLEQRDLQLRQFVADASHELRTPIAAISAYAELFDRGAAGNAEDLSRVMTGISAESARMQRLVDDLLTLARLDEGITPRSAPVELVGLCSEVVATARTVGPTYPITFVAQTPVEVLGDEAQLHRVLENLLANVRSHTPEGTSTKVALSTQGERVILEVTDDGPGMEAEVAEHAFDRFFREDPARVHHGGGSGLGLAIVAAIVKAHHGTVVLRSAPGSGAAFTISLPLAPLVEP